MLASASGPAGLPFAPPRRRHRHGALGPPSAGRFSGLGVATGRPGAFGRRTATFKQVRAVLAQPGAADVASAGTEEVARRVRSLMDGLGLGPPSLAAGLVAWLGGVIDRQLLAGAINHLGSLPVDFGADPGLWSAGNNSSDTPPRTSGSLTGRRRGRHAALPWRFRQMLERYGASAADERARGAHKRMGLGDRF